jgi:hypothetical protein
MDNFLYIPFINPVKLVERTPAVLAKYFSRHFEDFLFKERLYEWQQPEDFKQVWQTTDIINLQFESTFDPIIVELVNKYGQPVITLPALIGLPNKFLPNTFSYQVELSLASLQTGCYWIRVTAGTGNGKKVLMSGAQYVSEEQIANSICLEYWNSRFHEDVVFETGIKFQVRMPGHFGFLLPGSKTEQFKDELYNPAILSSRSFRQWPLYFGDEFGLPDDIVDLLNRIWTCNNVLVDGKPFGSVDGRFEFVPVDRYPKRGVKLNVEEGINRRSKIFAVETDTTKKLMATVIVDAKVFGDISNQGSSNAVPITNIE